MDFVAHACLGFTTLSALAHFLSNGLAWARCRPGRAKRQPKERPAISVVRPLCGLEPYSRETLLSSFQVDYPDYEVLFCVADADDPILPLVREVMEDNHSRSTRLLVGRERVGTNPKLNNMAKGWRAAQFDHIVFVDSNVFMPQDYLDQIACSLEGGAGMVSAPPVGLVPNGFWADVECAFLNTFQARMQYAIDTLGYGFAQGKTLFFRRADLDNGGFRELASEPAEDAAATKLMRSTGKRISLAGPFPQMIGPRSATQLWNRQVRWARLRRASFPLFYTPEIFAGSLPPLLALLFGVHTLEIDPAITIVGFLAIWYLPEYLLARALRWPASLSALLLRDAMLPAIYVSGVLGGTIEWHGQKIDISTDDVPVDHRRHLPRAKSRIIKLMTRALSR